MGRPLYHECPDLLTVEATVLDARPGAVLVERSPFFPGGGGQLADRGTLAWQGGELAVTGVTPGDGGTWLALDGEATPAGTVLLAVAPGQGPEDREQGPAEPPHPRGRGLRPTTGAASPA